MRRAEFEIPHGQNQLHDNITHLPMATPSIDQSNRSPRFLNFQLTKTTYHLTLTMTSTQVVETSLTKNSPSQDSNHPDDLLQSRYVTPGFKPFSYDKVL